MNIYDLTAERHALNQALLDAAEDFEMGEDDEDRLSNWLSVHEGDAERKLEAIGAVIRESDARAAGIKNEEARLATLRKSEERTIERLKEAVCNYLAATGQKAVKTPLFTFTRAQNGGKDPLVLAPFFKEDPLRIPEQFRTEKVTWAADTEALRAAIAAGDPDALTVAIIGERGFHTRIR